MYAVDTQMHIGTISVTAPAKRRDGHPDLGLLDPIAHGAGAPDSARRIPEARSLSLGEFGAEPDLVAHRLDDDVGLVRMMHNGGGYISARDIDRYQQRS